jgi:hypothetical protein
LKFDGSVECWGSDKHGETTVPNGLVAKQIAVGYTHSCALKINGTGSFLVNWIEQAKTV